MPRALHCTTWPPCLTFPSPAPVPLRRMGPGIKNGNLATAVSALELVTAGWRRPDLSRDKDGDTFHGAVVNLGALGVVTKVTLDVQPTFMMRQDVYENLPLAEVTDHFEDIMSSGYSVSLFTDWQNKTDQRSLGQTRASRRATRWTPNPNFYGAKARDQESPPDRRPLGGELHGADGSARPLV